MQLTLESGRSIQNPNTSEIQTALAAHSSSGGGLAILSKDKQTYMQASGDAKSGFRIEYQDGDTDQHFVGSRSTIPLEELIRAFQSYAVSDEKWRTMFEWTKLDEADFRRTRGCLSSAAAIGMAFAAGTVALCMMISLSWR